jgi:hypothetical protein
VNKEDLSVDQAMFVIAGVRTRHTYDGRVARIARKYVTIEYWVRPGITRELEFDIDTQKERGPNGYYPSAAVFRTKEQQALIERQQAADSGLLELGLTRRMGRESLSLLEIEAVVATVRWMREGQEDAGSIG